MFKTENIKTVAEWLQRAQHIVAFTGAGISTPSGIPDFRSPESGMWHGVDPMQVASIYGLTTPARKPIAPTKWSSSSSPSSSKPSVWRRRGAAWFRVSSVRFRVANSESDRDQLKPGMVCATVKPRNSQLVTFNVLMSRRTAGDRPSVSGPARL